MKATGTSKIYLLSEYPIGYEYVFDVELGSGKFDYSFDTIPINAKILPLVYCLSTMIYIL